MKNPFRNREDPEVKATFEKAKREARLERAKQEGRQAGLTRQKSFFEKMGDVGTTLSKGFDGGGGMGFDLFDEPKKKRRKSKKRRKRK
jgi:hypothetical protein